MESLLLEFGSSNKRKRWDSDQLLPAAAEETPSIQLLTPEDHSASFNPNFSLIDFAVVGL